MRLKAADPRNVVDGEALRSRQLCTTSAPPRPALPAPSHPASPLKKGIEFKNRFFFFFPPTKSLKCFFSSSSLLSPLAPQQPSSAWPLTAGRCSLQAGWGSWPPCARTSPQTAGRRWLLGGTCSSSLCLLSSKAPPPAATHPARLVRACETCPQPHPDPKAEPSCPAQLAPSGNLPTLASSTGYAAFLKVG